MSSCSGVSTSRWSKEKGEVANLDEIDLGEAFVIPRLLNIKNRDNVLVIEVA